MIFRTAIFPAILAVALTGATASAAPIVPLPGVSGLQSIEQLRLGNHPLMEPGAWDHHQRQWNAFEGRRGGASNSCTRFRGYSARTNTYVNRNGRRVACP